MPSGSISPAQTVMTEDAVRSLSARASSLSNQAWHLDLTLALFITISGLLLYFNTVFNNYALDDLAVIQENRFTRQGIAGIPDLLSTFYWQGYWNNNSGLYRPLSMVTFALEWQFFPENPHAGHITNIILYAITGFFLFRMLRRLMAKHNIILPFVISVLFVFHPIHTEVVANIKSRDEILCMLFLLLAADNLLGYFDTGKRWRMLAATLCYFLCLLSKESAISFIVIFPLLIIYFREIKLKKLLMLMLPLVATIAVYFIIRLLILGTNVSGKEYTYLDNSLVAAPDLMSRLATAFFMLGKYLKLLIIPYPLSYDYSYLEVPFFKWSDYQASVSLLVYASAAIFSVRSLFRNDKNIFAFGILFYILSLAVASNVLILIGCTMADRFLYIPSLGFCIILAYALFRIFNVKKNKIPVGLKDLFIPNKWMILLTMAILIPWGAETIGRNPDWKDNLTLFASDADSSPGSSRVRTNYGSVLLQKYNRNDPDKEKQAVFLDKAIEEFRAAITIDPNHPMAYLDLGAALYLKNDYKGSIESLKTAVRLDPSDPKPYSTLGNAYYRIRDYSNAISNLNKCIKLKSTSSETYNFLGSSYFGIADYPDALAAYLKAVELDPKNFELHLNLGSIYGAMGNYTDALKSFHKADQLNPGNVQVLSFIGMTFQNMQNHDSARFYSNKILKIQQK